MRSRYLIHYDADGGGFGAFLLSYVGASLIADAIGFRLVTVNPLIRSVFDINEDLAIDRVLSSANILRMDEIIGYYGNCNVSFDQLTLILENQNCDCLIYGRHHLPRIVLSDFLRKVGSLSYSSYASSVLSSIFLIPSLKNIYDGLNQYSMGIHIRTFFDSISGNNDFRKYRSLFYGFLIEEIGNKSLGHCCYLACDNEAEWGKARQIITNNGISVLNEFRLIRHSSLANYFGDKLLYANRPLNDDLDLIIAEANFNLLDALQIHLQPTLLDWFGLGKSDYILCTNTSFAISAALFFRTPCITFPCRSDLINLSIPLSLV
jgi:hypothetical protein